MKPFLIFIALALVFTAGLAYTMQNVVPGGSITITPNTGETLQVTDSAGKVYNPTGGIVVAFMSATPTPTPTPSPTATPTPTPSPTATPSGPGIAVACPKPNQSVPSPVSVVAHASPNPGHQITAIRLYIDSKTNLTNVGADINQSVTMASGSRDLAFVAWDETGHAYKTEFNITVK